ncbi:hypothetical protein N9M11_02155 [Flavobacteriaceae bacterium]|uniref:hypothetical protein n=1 Tax=Candidatus Arcticimaribacter forsetii TaxID=2820661 RepID=UPI00207739C4|nr:hypothetical protein [Candidatus Arcticimaribacter forsetii]MDA8698904.1 hypothetical protein [Flavobacteriaceae bacterium]MDB4620847.1 hypothetical protein [Flavobacteriaceae bacterium]MDB4751048.1 hypothetical protein [Flavobacteriaceae bacterium]
MKLLWSIIIILFSLNIKAQTNSEIESNTEEQIHLHINNTVFLPGEYLYYKLNLINPKNRKYSKIAYVQLIDSEKNIVSTQKLIIEEGKASGDIFIKENLLSGSYKLIAFTNLIKSKFQNEVYKQNLVILNPYSVDQNKINIDPNASNKLLDSIKTDPDNQWAVSTNKSKYTKRELIILTVKTRNNSVDSIANVSISIRKKNKIPAPERKTIKELKNQTKTSLVNLNSKNSIAELKGEVFSGKINLKPTKKPVKNKLISVSIAGNPFQFKQVKTNNLGEFKFTIPYRYEASEIIIQPLEYFNQEITINLDPKENIDLSTLVFEDYTLSKNHLKPLVERSLRNQIENAYFKFKKDSINILSQYSYFNESEKEFYELDDYKRFKTFKETCFEFIKSIVIRKNKNKKHSIFVKTKTGKILDLASSPLILLNGTYVEDLEKLIQYDTRKVKRISIYKEPYVFGKQRYQGVILISTFDPTEKILSDRSQSRSFSIIKPEANKKYYKQIHNDQTKRLPDERHQLFWSPNIKLNSSKKDIQFYSSDVLGTYWVEIEGFSKLGKPISLTTSFEVN